ncbi:unnamed protein product [Prorocentrum cordatum]|uniref:Polynucleotide adenylyltransferase n=1 Tax=Prorocentrum cordatum TaxID=2364126 RepID=A0ABN9QQ61_9DINO|nr:unnamed protein product [Polarella glacialis]
MPPCSYGHGHICPGAGHFSSVVDGVTLKLIEGGHEVIRLPPEQVYDALKTLIQQYSHHANQFSMELIDDARVPILRVLFGTGDRLVAVDVSVDQMRPVDHVKWFQYVCAAPRPNAPPPLVAPLVTSTLRCVKWWIRQRQIPRTKEGGLPTLAWLLMAVHVCSLKETHEQAWPSHTAGPMLALLSSLTASTANGTGAGTGGGSQVGQCRRWASAQTFHIAGS